MGLYAHEVLVVDDVTFLACFKSKFKSAEPQDIIQYAALVSYSGISCNPISNLIP